MVTPATKRAALEILKNKGLAERAACRFAGVSRRVPAYEPKQPAKDKALENRIDGSVSTLSPFWLSAHRCDDR